MLEEQKEHPDNQHDVTEETEEVEAAVEPVVATPEKESISQGNSWHPTALALGIVVLAIAVYAVSVLIPLHGEELFLFGEGKPLEQLVTMPAGSEVLPNAPLAVFSLAVNRALSPNTTMGLHIGNILLHALNGMLLFFLIRKWLGASSETWFAAAAAGLFIVLPIHTEVVASLTGRGILQATFFSLAALLFLLRAQGFTGGILALTCYILAVGSHFSAAALPVAALGLLLFKPQGVQFHYTWRHTLPGFAVGFALLLVRAASGIPQQMELVEGTLPRLQAQTLYFHQYCISLFSPGSQILLIDYLEWAIIGGILLIALFAMCGWATWLKHPLTAPLLWFLGMASIVPCIVPQLDIALPRYTYASLAGLVMMGAWAFTLIRDARQRKNAGLIALLVIASCGLVSGLQVWAWQDPLSHWAAVAEANPNHPYPHLQAARHVFYMASQEEEESERIKRFGETHQRLRRALAADPYNAETLSMLGQALYYREALDEAIPTLKDALKKEPHNQTTAIFLAQALEQQASQTPDLETYLSAMHYYAHADRIAPLVESNMKAAEQYAMLSVTLKQYYAGYFRLKAVGADAEDHPMYPAFQLCGETVARAQGLEKLAAQQLQEDPASQEAGINKAEAAMLRGKNMQSLYQLQRATRQDPQNERAWLLTGIIKAQMNDAENFLYQYGPQAPPNPTIWNQLASQCAEKGLILSGIKYLQYAEFDKSHAQPYVNMAIILLQLQQPDRAIAILNQGRQEHPNDYRPVVALCELAISQERWEQAQAYLAEATRLNAPEAFLAPLEQNLGIKGGVPTEPVRTIIR